MASWDQLPHRIDELGHVNNVVYYAYFDTAICRYLMVEAGVDIVNGPILPFTVENGCRYYRSLAFPQVLEAGLGVARLGTSRTSATTCATAPITAIPRRWNSCCLN